MSNFKFKVGDKFICNCTREDTGCGKVETVISVTNDGYRTKNESHDDISFFSFDSQLVEFEMYKTKVGKQLLKNVELE